MYTVVNTTDVIGSYIPVCGEDIVRVLDVYFLIEHIAERNRGDIN